MTVREAPYTCPRVNALDILGNNAHAVNDKKYQYFKAF